MPIVEGERKRRKREGEKKNRTHGGPRLSADEVMARYKLKGYQDSYAKSMKIFGLERGIVGSTAKHVVASDYYKQTMQSLEENIAKLQKEAEAAREGRSKFFSFFGKGELAQAKKDIADKDRQIAELNRQISLLKQEKEALIKKHKEDIAKLRNGYQAEISKAIKAAESQKAAIQEKNAKIEQQTKQIDQLDRKANPSRYRLSSGAMLEHHFIPNYMYPSIHIWTKVGDVEFENHTELDRRMCQQYSDGEITIHELINAVFEPWEQVNEAQANLLGAAFELTTGGPAQAHIGTGSGGSSSDLPWNDKDRKKGGRSR